MVSRVISGFPEIFEEFPNFDFSSDVAIMAASLECSGAGACPLLDRAEAS
jgi:hypothetical protein